MMDIARKAVEFIEVQNRLLLSEFHHLVPTPERRFHAFGIGLPRSGTHSLAFMFNKSFKSAHEPKSRQTINSVLSWQRGKYSEPRMLNILALRDKMLGLEFEAAHYLHHIVELLAPLFPDAKFILTLRDPVSWLESEANQNYITRNLKTWRSIERYRYSPYLTEAANEEAIRASNVYPVAAYLGYWESHISKVFKTVPEERLLIVDTSEISSRLHDIASFVGTRTENLDVNKQWSGKREAAYAIFDYVSREEVCSQAQACIKRLVDSGVPYVSRYLTLDSRL